MIQNLGVDYTNYVLERTNFKKLDEPFYRENGNWYERRLYSVEDVNRENVGESIVRYLEKNFSSDKTKLSEARYVDSVAIVRVTEPTEEYQVDIEEVGSKNDLKDLIRNHENSFPEEADFLGYVEFDNQIESIEENLNRNGDVFRAFFIDIMNEETKKKIYSIVEQESDEEWPEFHAKMITRSFILQNDTVYEIKND